MGSYPVQQPRSPWQQGAAYPPWQAYGRPPPVQTGPPAPPPWPVPVPEATAPWWALLLGGLGLGSAAALLGTLFWRRRPQQAAPGWPGWDGHASPAGGQAPPPRQSPAGNLPLRDTAAWPTATSLSGSALPTSTAAIASSGTEFAASQLVGETTSVETLAAGRLDELTAQMRAHVQETRDATAALRRTLEQQQWQYQRTVSDFQMKLEEASRRKTTTASQRIEISPESLKMLRSMVCPANRISGSGCLGAATSANNSSEALRHWFEEVESNLRRLLRSAGSKSDAKRSLQTISIVVHNLVTNPTQEKYREVNTSSARFRETLGGSDGGAAELLQLAGFECRDQTFVFPAERDLDSAERVRDILQDALRDCDKRWEEACKDGGAVRSASVMAGEDDSGGGSGSKASGGGPLLSCSEPSPPVPTLGAQSCASPAGPCLASAARRGPAESSQGQEGPPWLSRAPWASGGRNSAPSPSGAAACSVSVAGASSSSCSDGAPGPSAGPPPASSSSPEVSKPTAPWFSSVVQRQLAQKPAAGSGARATALGMGGAEDEEARASSAPASQAAAPAAAHPAEAQEGSQEPQSGG